MSHKLLTIPLCLLFGVFCWPKSIAADDNNKARGALGKQPNILFIVADDMTAEDIGCYGNPGIKTPNLDQLAEGGIRFHNGFVTISSCAPSRGSMMLGRYPHANAMAELKPDLHHNHEEYDSFVRKLDNMAQVLQQAGYYTMQSGKWHIGGLYKWNKPSGYFTQFFDDAKTVNVNQNSGTYRWIETLNNRPKNRPFFAWFATFDAHRYAKKARQVHSEDDVRLPPYVPDVSTKEYDTKKDLAGYYDKVARGDKAVGEIIAELKKQNIYKNTLIVFIADNGRGFGRGKVHIHDSGVRVPFIAHWPEGIQDPGRVSYDLVSSIDIAPTFLELSGGRVEGTTFQGRSFLKILNNEPNYKHRTAIFSERNHHIWEGHERGVRTEDFLYIKNRRPTIQRRGSDNKDDYSFWFAKDQLGIENMKEEHRWFFENPAPEELFHVKSDPDMIHNLANSIEYKSNLESLRETLKTWEKQTGDTAPKQLTRHFRDSTHRNRPKVNQDIAKLIGEQPGWSYWKDKTVEQIVKEASVTRSKHWIP